MQKIATEQKSTKKWFDRAALWRVYVYLISSTSTQKENPVTISVRPINIRCAKYKFAERSHNFLLQLPMQLIFGDLWDLDKLQICAKGKSILECPSMSKEIQKMQKNCNRAKSTKIWFDREALWRVYVYLISSTSMQKENAVANSVRSIKICWAKYKFAERSHNFLIVELTQMFWWKSRIVAIFLLFLILLHVLI